MEVVRELLGAMVGAGAAGGYVVTSGQFTKDACAFARDNNIQLLDGKDLRKILKTKSKSSGPVVPINPVSKPNSSNRLDPEENAQTCQKCGSAMVVRVAKKGNRAGEKFLGCSNFPRCRFTMPIS